MTGDTTVDAVLDGYPAPYRPRTVQSLENAGGFSGARFWKLRSPAGTFCLRCWPRTHPSPARLREIHSVLLHVAKAGLTSVPAPIPNTEGRSFVDWEGSLWELAPWLPGEASYHREPSQLKLDSAMETLARFHTISAGCTGLTTKGRSPPGIGERRDMLTRLLHGGIQQISDAVGRHPRAEYAMRAQRLLAAFPCLAPAVSTRLAESATLAVDCQPCIRDIWHDHVLFVVDQVTGIVDFGAMRPDNVACDIARLLGSLVGDDGPRRQMGLEAYQRIRPLTAEEVRLVDAYDISSVLLSGINWLHWIYVERRHFEQTDRILRRLDECLLRLEFRTTNHRDDAPDYTARG